jgi:hypothetical protein
MAYLLRGFLILILRSSVVMMFGALRPLPLRASHDAQNRISINDP